MKHFQDKLIANIKAGDIATANVEKWEPKTWPEEAKGVGFTEAPRGALAHWIKIKDGKIDNYQCVVPTTWNGSPRDPKGKIGAFEAALMDTPMADPQQPLEILRTHPQLRSLPRLRDARDERGRPGNGESVQGPLRKAGIMTEAYASSGVIDSAWRARRDAARPSMSMRRRCGCGTGSTRLRSSSLCDHGLFHRLARCRRRPAKRAPIS